MNQAQRKLQTRANKFRRRNTPHRFVVQMTHFPGLDSTRCSSEPEESESANTLVAVKLSQRVCYATTCRALGWSGNRNDEDWRSNMGKESDRVLAAAMRMSEDRDIPNVDGQINMTTEEWDNGCRVR